MSDVVHFLRSAMTIHRTRMETARTALETARTARPLIANVHAFIVTSHSSCMRHLLGSERRVGVVDRFRELPYGIQNCRQRDTRERPCPPWHSAPPFKERPILTLIELSLVVHPHTNAGARCLDSNPLALVWGSSARDAVW